MANPTVPRRANQIPRSLPAGVGGGDGFSHHPKPVSNGPEGPENYPMRQRRYRGAGGGDYQWDSRTETPVWREIPRDKNLPKRQYSPSPREQFPNTYRKSRYKPGTLRIPTQNPPEKPTIRPPKKPSDWIKKGVTGGIKDYLKDEALKPSTAGDGTLPGGAFPPLPPRQTWPAPEPESICGTTLDRSKWGARKGDRLEVFEYGVYLRGGYTGPLGTGTYSPPDQGRIQFPRINNKWIKGTPWMIQDHDMAISNRWSVYYKYFDFIIQEEVEKLYGWVYELNIRPKTYINKRGWIYGDVFTTYTYVLNGTGKGQPKKQKNYEPNIISARLSRDHGAVPIYKPEFNPSENEGVYGYASWGLICQNTDFGDGEDGGNYEDDDDYDFDVDEDTEMGCQWQKDEVEYQLPKLQIGDKEVGGGSIRIDDGLIPFADYMCKSIEIMFKGLGLDKVAQELPKNILKRGMADPKFTPQSLGELMHWQFNNVSGLVGAPVETAIKNINGDEKTIPFRSVQDVISALFHQQKESDLDLWVIENYCVRMAQQLEAVTQICLKQDADIDMLVKEAGFKWEWETRERQTLYKHGMREEDERTGIVELFKGGKVSYPVRIWKDEFDARQISMTTNLYSEISAKQGMFKIDPSEDLPGFAARKKMKKNDDEKWKEYVKTVNSVSQSIDGGQASRVVSGMTAPFIEEYTKGTVTAKKVDEPKSGLSLFQKKPKEKKR